VKPVVIVDSGGANLASLQHALARLSVQAIVSSEATQIEQASHVILPGVGAAAMAMERLRARGLIEVLRRLEQPLLGICLGMQLLFEHSAEGDTPCLGLLKGRVERFQGDTLHPVPHMGWNTLMTTSHPLLKDCDQQWFYFVHSYYVPEHVPSGIATTRYQHSFTAAVGQGNVMGVQCHPERSAEAGRQLLRNFLDLPAQTTR
jgi:glutamine amidotransferase